jgi:hypothetical protein
MVSSVLGELVCMSSVFNERHVAHPIVQWLAHASYTVLTPLEKAFAKAGISLPLHVASANPGPYYTARTDRGVSPGGALWDGLRRSVYDHTAAVNRTLTLPETRRRAQASVTPGQKIVIPWFGPQFALGDTVLAAAAWQLMSAAHSVTVLVDDAFGGIKGEIVRRCAPSVKVRETKLDDAVTTLEQLLDSDQLVIIPSNYGPTATGALLRAIEEILHRRPLVNTFIGFFDWDPTRRISRTSRAEVIASGSNPVLAYLQAQVCMRMSVEATDFLVPQFRVLAEERTNAAMFLAERGVDLTSPGTLLVLIGDTSSHPFKRLSRGQTEALMAQLIDEAKAQGLEIWFALVDPGSSIDLEALPYGLARRIAYHARRDGGRVKTYEIMGLPRSLCIGCDSFVSHGYAAITQDIPHGDRDRRQILLFGWWGDLDELTWIPCGPAEVVDARAIVGRKARVDTLPFGERTAEGSFRVPLLSRRYTVG